MTRMLVKPDGSGVVITIRLTLNYDQDDDLIARLAQAPPRGLAGLVRRMLRTGVSIETVPAQVEEEFDTSEQGWEL